MEGINNQNRFSVLLWVLIVLITGLSGLASLILLMIFSRLSIGRDPLMKHGLISGTSRLGGLVIFISTFIGISINLQLVDSLSYKLFLNEFSFIFIVAFIIGLIGLVEDLSQKLKSFIRLLIMIVIVMIALYVRPDMLPMDMPLFTLYNLNSVYLVYIVTTLMIVGFINAGNMTDGANGLLSIITLMFILVLYMLYPSVLNLSLIISLVSFAIYNISTGRIFLGDFGAYFLSSYVAFSSLITYSEFNLPIFLFASLLVYPCFEITRSIFIRLITGASIMSPDNKHLHNYIHEYILLFGFSQNIVNSLTGIIIAILTSGPAFFIIYTNKLVEKSFWVNLFIIEMIVLSLVYIILANKLGKIFIKK